MSVTIRPATLPDADAMANLLNEIIQIGGTTALRGTFDAARIIESFLQKSSFVSCIVAEHEGLICGFQSLELASSDWCAKRGLSGNGGSIATFVSPHSHGLGIGRRLFSKTLQEARAAQLTWIDATIRLENTGGRAFYTAIGFEDYHQTDLAISKKFLLLDENGPSTNSPSDTHAL